MNDLSNKGNKGIAAFLTVVLLFLVVMVAVLKMSEKEESPYKYSEIMQYFDNYQVSEYTFDLGTGELIMTVDGQEEKIVYKVPNVNVFITRYRVTTRPIVRNTTSCTPMHP